MTRAVLILVVLLACFGASAQTEHVQAPEPAVLSLWNRQIVTFRATVDGVPPAQRVHSSHKRIDEYLKAHTTAPVATRVTTIGD